MPDHGGLRPWRFAVVRGAGRARFGDALAAAAGEAGAALRTLLGMAPTDRLLGWVNLGRPVEDAPPTRREMPDLESLVTRLD